MQFKTFPENQREELYIFFYAGCGTFVSTGSVITCTGVVGRILTIPCGNLEESTGQFSYHIQKSINRTSFFLQWNLQVADDGLNIHCFSNNVLQGTYQLDISCKSVNILYEKIRMHSFAKFKCRLLSNYDQ